MSFGLTCALNAVWSELSALEVTLLGYHTDVSSPQFVLRPASALRGILPFRKLLLSTPKVICFLQSANPSSGKLGEGSDGGKSCHQCCSSAKESFSCLWSGS